MSKAQASLLDPKYAEQMIIVKEQIKAKSHIWQVFLFCCHNEAIEMVNGKVPLPPYTIPIKEFAMECTNTEMMYDEHRMKIPQKEVDAELAKGITDLFDTVLASKLLTKIEHRFHYDYMCQVLADKGITDFTPPSVCPCIYKMINMEDKPPVVTHPAFRPHEHYGTLHLFRLIFRLPELLPLINIAPEALELTYSYVERLVAYILDHFDTLVRMKEEYRVVPEQYALRSASFHTPPFARK